MEESTPQKNFFDISEDELPDPFAPEAQTLQVAKTVPVTQTTALMPYKLATDAFILWCYIVTEPRTPCQIIVNMTLSPPVILFKIEQLQIPPEALQQIFHDPKYSVKSQAVNLQVPIDEKDVDLSREPRNIVPDVGAKDSETDIVLAGLIGVFFYKHHRKGIHIHIHRGSLLGDE
eukprot:m51a1_g1721 hypothetical protein (175) ;mRNA; f:71091-71615